MQAEPRRVTIVEERTSGHLLVYVRILAKRALARGMAVTLAVPVATLSSNEYQLHLADLATQTSIVHIPDRVSVMALNRLAEDMHSTGIIVPHGDELGTQAAVRGGVGRTRLVLLIMRDPRWERPAPLARTAKGLAKLAIISAASIRRGVRVVWLREPSYRGGKAELFAIDPFIADGSMQEIETGAVAMRHSLVLDDDVYWFGIVGAITSRKNVPLVVDALREASRTARRTLGLALIGPIAPTAGFDVDELVEACSRAGIPLVIEDRLITNFEMNSAVRALDAVVLAYSTHSPNSTLGKAYVLGTQVVAAGPPSIRRFVDELGFGFHSELSAKPLSANLLKASESGRPDAHPGAVSEDQFADALLDAAIGER